MRRTSIPGGGTAASAGWLRRFAVLCFAAGIAAACTTSLGDEEDDSSGPAGPLGTGNLHRLNRAEYSNTMRDLLGEPLRLGDNLPADELSSLGYDNDGASLAVSPLLFERWVDLAERAIESYFSRLSPLEQEFPLINQPCDDVRPGLDACGPPNGQVDSATGFYGVRSAEDPIVVEGFVIPADGFYTVRLSAYAKPVLAITDGGGQTAVGEPYPVVLTVSVDGSAKSFDITDVAVGEPLDVAFALELTRGKHVVEVRSVRDELDPDDQDGNWYEHTAWVDAFRVTGPEMGGDSVPEPPPLIDCEVTKADCRRSVLEGFAARAWRRGVSSAEVDGLLALAEDPETQGEGTDEEKALSGLKLALQAVLVSPHFVYRPELAPAETGKAVPLGDYELASRLSYFLWSSMPDQTLFDLAADGKLADSAELSRQVERMLADPKAQALVDDFAGQWLNLRRVEQVSPLPDKFPDFTDSVKEAMRTESELFFSEFLSTDRSFKELLTADFTFANEELARYYGLEAEGMTDAFEQVPLEGSHRMGLLSQGTILTTTSHSNRTSPVIRGKFVLKQLLCQPPPSPPANVPPFDEDESAGSVRERLEAHRADAGCSSCHERMDDVGFSLENFEAAGRYRTEDDGGFAIDTSDLSLDDSPISDVATLAQAVQGDSDFVECVVRQLYSYALGREATSADADTLSALEQGTQDDGYVLSSLIRRIVQSQAFRTKGEKSE